MRVEENRIEWKGGIAGTGMGKNEIKLYLNNDFFFFLCLHSYSLSNNFINDFFGVFMVIHFQIIS